MASLPSQPVSTKSLHTTSGSTAKHHQLPQFDNNHHFSNNSCPHHIALPDGEWGPDRDFQSRTPSQVNFPNISSSFWSLTSMKFVSVLITEGDASHHWKEMTLSLLFKFQNLFSNFSQCSIPSLYGIHILNIFSVVAFLVIKYSGVAFFARCLAHFLLLFWTQKHTKPRQTCKKLA